MIASGPGFLGEVPFNFPGALPDGQIQVSVSSQDAAGNASSPFNFSITIDSVAPAPLGNIGLLAADDTGSSNSDRITRIPRPRFAFTASEATYHSVTAGGLTGTATGTGNLTLQLSGALPDGVYDAEFATEDLAGNATTMLTQVITSRHS